MSADFYFYLFALKMPLLILGRVSNRFSAIVTRLKLFRERAPENLRDDPFVSTILPLQRLSPLKTRDLVYTRNNIVQTGEALGISAG